MGSILTGIMFYSIGSLMELFGNKNRRNKR